MDPTKKTQCQRILELLETGVAVSQLDALERIGCLRLAARMNDLKNAGHQWTREMITNAHGVRFARYQLETLPNV